MAGMLLMLLLCAGAMVSEGQRQPGPLVAGSGSQLRSQLLTVFTGNSSARAALRRQLVTARRYLRRTPPVPEEPPPSTTELCRRNGHSTCERHVVQTEDGYLLTVVRIAAGPGAIPALLMHGDLASSDSWMMRKDNSNFGTVLHEAGYDVWVGNFRGNTHSRDHATLNNTDPRFWNWSWHEMGMYDIPALMDYILKKTGARELHLLGHSMATSAYLVTLSERPEYNGKVRLASFMSPSIRMRGFIRWAFDQVFSRFRDSVESWLRRNEITEIWPRAASLHYIGDLFCMDDSPLINLCYSMYEEVLGKGHVDQRLPDYLATFGAYHPAGTSFRCLEHYGAVNLSGRFRPLGTGVDDPNPPPDYNLTAVTAPVAMYFSTNDGIIGKKDVDRLAKSLPRVVEYHHIPLKQFNHVDYMWAKDVRKLLYNRVIQKMKEFDSKAKKPAVDLKQSNSNIIR